MCVPVVKQTVQKFGALLAPCHCCATCEEATATDRHSANKGAKHGGNISVTVNHRLRARGNEGRTSVSLLEVEPDVSIVSP